MACQFETTEGGFERRFAANTDVSSAVYMIDDCATTRDGLTFALACEALRAVAFADAAAFQHAFAVARCDLAVVDVDRESGLALARILRKQHSAIGLVALSASGSIEARVRSLESGADTHLVKPVDPRELAAQLRALQRRLAAAPSAPAPSAPAAWLLKQDGWILEDPRGTQMDLTTAERAFLGCLIAAHGLPASREELLENLGNNPRDADPHRIDVLVNRLRRKAATRGMALPLHAVRGRGYALAAGTAVLPIAHELARIAASEDAAPRDRGSRRVLRPLFTRDPR